jgi:hypothetical protein
MSEAGGLDIGVPGEGGGSAPEQLSEEAKARFAAAAAAMIAIQREEKKSKKRDSRVAKTIIQFLNDDRYTHLFVLISRLVARDCPSVFILAVLSLINDDALSVVNEHIQEAQAGAGKELVSASTPVAPEAGLDAQANEKLLSWITCLQAVLAIDTLPILLKLMVDEQNIDGTVLQLTTFVLQEFFRSPVGGRREIAFEGLQGLSVSILQTVFEPFLDSIDRSLLQKPKAQETEDD